MESVCSHKNRRTTIHTSATCSSHSGDHLTSCGLINRQNVACPYNGVAFIHRRNEVLAGATDWVNPEIKLTEKAWHKKAIDVFLTTQRED